VQDAAIKRAPEAVVTSAETADLLEALRRRRGQRTGAPQTPTSEDESRGASPVALFDALEPGYAEAAEPTPAPESTRAEPTADAARRKGRTSMPSWDEIVFGARSDES
jgi:hypothetical protein